MNTTVKNIISPKFNELDYIAEYEKKPLEQRFTIDTSFGIIKAAGESFASDPALIQLVTADVDEQPEEISYGQFANKVTQTANLLHNLGITRTDTVSILLPNLTETQLALWGSQAAGIANPINSFLDLEHIVEIMNEVKVKALFTLATGQNPELDVKIHSIIEKVPTLTHVIVVGQTTEGAQSLSASSIAVEVVEFESAIAEQSYDKLIGGSPVGDDIALYFHTGGTTGRPKVAKVAHKNTAFVAQIYENFNAHHGRSTVLNVLPLFHVFSTMAASLGMFVQGRTVVMMTAEGFRHPNVVKNWWYFVERYQVIWFPLVPTIMAALLNQPFEKYDLSCFKYAASGSAPLPAELKRAFERQFDCKVSNGYGMTESTCLIARPIFGFDAPEDAIGNPIPYTQAIAAVVDGERLVKVCVTGEAGVILIKGPNVFAGYFDPKDNSGAWVDGDWFNTGDIGVFDACGRLKITGRAKDLIIRGGHNIDPQLIENSLMQHESISQVVAIGQPDAYAGEVPVAYVVIKPNKMVNELQLLDYCKASISERAAIPKRIAIIEEVPLTAVGKVFKPALRNNATEYAVKALFSAKKIEANVEAEYTATEGQLVNIKVLNSTVQTQSQTEILDLLKGLPVTVKFI